ncbi:MAG: helix-turn-helix domain-containing protein [Actinomycetota bacterium]|jgi:DNA-binding HxlR family transcriptional regulator
MGKETEVVDVDWRSACSITSGLDVLGDKWSLLIVRDLIAHGTRTYSEFRESPEHVATNILASRLRLLTSLGIIERTDPDRAARNNAYRLTPSGAALRPVLEELGKWSQSYLKQFHADMVDSI